MDILDSDISIVHKSVDTVGKYEGRILRLKPRRTRSLNSFDAVEAEKYWRSHARVIHVEDDCERG